MKHLLVFTFLLLLSVSLSAKEQNEQQSSGTMLAAIWLTSTEGDKTETYQKGGKWFGKLVASNSKYAPLGTTVLRNFVLIDGQWSGYIPIAFFSITLKWHNEKSQRNKTE